MKHILITGASSGIGQALALEYSAPDIKLSLLARHEERLLDVVTQCRNKGADVDYIILDVMDREGISQWLHQQDQKHPLDLIIANAGISGLSENEDQWEDATHDVFNVNVIGVINSFLPMIQTFLKRKNGQIAIMSSLAGFRGMASSTAYSATKVCVKAYGEALRVRYKNDGLKVNVICPGFVKSRITDQNKFVMPMIMEGEKAAKIIRKGLEHNKAIITFPWQIAALVRFYALLPLWVIELLAKFIPVKE